MILPSPVLLRGVKSFETDVSGLPVDGIFKGQAIQEDSWTLENGKIWSIETSALNHPAQRESLPTARS